jgi:aldehyde:ferredoxin oxidoreductase
MGYSHPETITYQFASHDFGAGAGATSFKGPKGKSGVLRDIGVKDVTETFSNTTTAAFVRVGTSGDADAYAEANLGTTAATDTFVASHNDTDAIINRELPADTQIEVTYVAPTGGTPAGIGCPYVVVDWF